MIHFKKSVIEPKKHSILFPLGSFYPAQTGGPDNTVYWLTLALTKRGHNAIISSTDNGQPSDTPRGIWLDTDYGKVIYTANPVHYLPLAVVWYACRNLKAVDVLHINMVTYPAAFVMGFLNRVTYNKPVVWSTRGELDPPMLERSARLKKIVLWLIRKGIGIGNILFHSTCDEETGYIRTVFGEHAKVAQIPNYMLLPERIAVEAKKQYLLYIGRIDPKKGLENLFKALHVSAGFQHSDFVLKVVGDYENAYGKSLIELSDSLGLSAKIEFLGHKAGVEKERLLAEAWFLLMPSHTENFGIVVIEALAQGTPALASTGTPWQQLEERGAGYWVSNQPEELATAIDSILALRPEQYDLMCENAIQLVDEYDINSHISTWEKLYEDLGKSHHAK